MQDAEKIVLLKEKMREYVTSSVVKVFGYHASCNARGMPGNTGCAEGATNGPIIFGSIAEEAAAEAIEA